MTTRPRKTSSKCAFTLIEIMVATVIMVIMVGLVIQITSQVLNVWNRSTGKLAANAQARIAMDLLTSDLEAALLRDNGQQWLRVESPADVTADVGAVGQTVGLKLFTPAQDAPEGPGDICAVAYRLGFGDAYLDASVQTFILYRDIENPSDTFNNLLGSGSGSPQEDISVDPVFWSNASIEVPENYLVSNVVDFKVFAFGEENAAGEFAAFNDSDGDRVIDTNYVYGGTGGTDVEPRYFEIVLTVVSDEGRSILELPSLGGTGFSDPADVVRTHGQVFTRRVYLPGAGI